MPDRDNDQYKPPRFYVDNSVSSRSGRIHQTRIKMLQEKAHQTQAEMLEQQEMLFRNWKNRSRVVCDPSGMTIRI